jgi:MFS family permease
MRIDTDAAIGVIVTSTLIGNALLTLWVGFIANRYSRRRLLLAAVLLMAATGGSFATMTDFWPLLAPDLSGRASRLIFATRARCALLTYIVLSLRY